MAVDLTPRFRRINSQSASMRETGRTASAGPFRATQLWRDIIHALQTQVEVRRRRQHLRMHSGCFAGSDAVDVVLSHLMQSACFRSGAVSRLKAARLCQALMESRVFEPVGTRLLRRDKEPAFEDTSSSLYRFLDGDAGTPSADEPGGKKKTIPRMDFIIREDVTNSLHRLEQVTTIPNPLALESSDRRIEKLLQSINLRPTLPSNAKPEQPAVVLPKTVVAEVWKQQTLLHLLQIVDLPFLDGVLESPAKAEQPRVAPSRGCADLVISNTCVEREVTQSLDLRRLDMWLMAAIDCLEYFPDQMIVAAGEHLSQQCADGHEREHMQKKLLFDTISKYYGQEREPLLTSHYVDIHTGIVELLGKRVLFSLNRGLTNHARFLSSSLVLHLLQLLAFMAEAAEPEGYRLQKQHDNRTVVCRTFLKAIVQKKSLSKIQAEQLVLFLMETHTELFKTPTSLITTVGKKLQSLQQGRDPDSTAAFTYCEQLTLEQYKEQGLQATVKQLRLLVRDIEHSASLPAKEKDRLVKELQKHHPSAFLLHYSVDF
uniref:DEP domain containing 4 n=1 Tax=Lepisosteus oculatus TaxID=7918 RepID=W5NDF5_LEPOC